MTECMTNAEIDALCEALGCETNYTDDLHRQALTAIRQLQRGWMGIESAPKDGTHVIATGQYETSGERYVLADVYWLSGYDWLSVSDGTVTPTAWMPLPHAPEPGQ